MNRREFLALGLTVLAPPFLYGCEQSGQRQLTANPFPEFRKPLANPHIVVAFLRDNRYTPDASPGDTHPVFNQVAQAFRESSDGYMRLSFAYTDTWSESPTPFDRNKPYAIAAFGDTVLEKAGFRLAPTDIRCYVVPFKVTDLTKLSQEHSYGIQRMGSSPGRVWIIEDFFTAPGDTSVFLEAAIHEFGHAILGLPQANLLNATEDHGYNPNMKITVGGDASDPMSFLLDDMGIFGGIDRIISGFLTEKNGDVVVVTSSSTHILHALTQSGAKPRVLRMPSSFPGWDFYFEFRPELIETGTINLSPRQTMQLGSTIVHLWNGQSSTAPLRLFIGRGYGGIVKNTPFRDILNNVDVREISRNEKNSLTRLQFTI